MSKFMLLSGKEDMETSELISLLQSEQLEDRRIASRKLRDVKHREAVPYLIQALKDEDLAVRRSSVSTLGVIGDPAAFEHVELASYDSETSVRHSSCKSLVRLGGVRALDRLSGMLYDDSQDIRTEAVKAAKGIAEPAALVFFAEVLMESYIPLRRLAIEGISRFKTDLALNLLLSELGNDKETDLRVGAIEGIGRMLANSSDAGVAFLTVNSHLTSEDPIIKKSAIKAAGLIKDRKFLDSLHGMLAKDQGKDSLLVLDTVLLFEETSSIPYIQALADSELAPVRMRVARALGQIGGEENVERLQVLLYDENGDTRRAARESLNQIGGRQAFEALASKLIDDPFSVYKSIQNWPDERLQAEKADYIVSRILTQAGAMQVVQKQRHIIFNALLPKIDGKAADMREADRAKLMSFLVGQAIRYEGDAALTSILAELLTFGAGGSDLAAKFIEDYETKNQIEPDKLSQVRKYVGGEKALEPVLAKLQKNLDQHFLRPIDELNTTTHNMWTDTVKQATRGFTLRLVMSGLVFALGLVVACVSLYQFLFGDLDDWIGLIGAGVPLITGLGSILAAYYIGPIGQIRKSVADLGIIHISFMGYVHTVLETSQTFSALILDRRMNLDGLEKINGIISNAGLTAMKNLRDVSEKET